MATITPEDAQQIVVDALTKSNTSAANAAAVGRALVAAELNGQAGHGLRRLAAYSAQSAAGKVDGHAVPVAEKVRPATLAIDAGSGFAFPALELATDLLPDLARAQGIAAAGLRRSHHSGVAGLPVETLARRNVIGLMVGNSPPAIAPWGSNTPLFGTNPISFAAPVPGAEPIVVDVSLSRVARGKIMAARQKGEKIPEGWAFDSDGQPTTDAEAALAGTMAPLGDAKGTALALMVELLCAGLTGANYAPDVSSFFNAEGPPPGTGQTIIAIDPEAFGSGALNRFAAMAGMVEAAEGARLPGRRRFEMAAEMAANGIPVDDDLMLTLRDLAEHGSRSA